MFRTADGAGLDHLYLCGITATPEHPRLAKAALGAQGSVSWSYHPNAVDLAASLIEDGFQLWGLERPSDAAVPLSLPPAVSHTENVILVVGNERIGIDPALMNLL
ncbi:MAG: TrmH family RNA methyltransferase [Chloroflexota bacterium]